MIEGYKIVTDKNGGSIILNKEDLCDYLVHDSEGNVSPLWDALTDLLGLYSCIDHIEIDAGNVRGIGVIPKDID